jgi:hypothetical protein
MKVIEQHQTPDGLLKFIIEDYGDDVALGFENFPWHTHPECLPPYQRDSWKQAVKQFIELLLTDQKVIGLRKKNGKLIDVWVVDRPEIDKYKPKDEEIQFRYWSGKPLQNFIR